MANNSDEAGPGSKTGDDRGLEIRPRHSPKTIYVAFSPNDLMLRDGPAGKSYPSG